jgi:hypothetical protein
MPNTSTSKNGLTAFGSDSVALLPAGREVSDQWNVRALPSTSDEPLPSRVMRSVTRAVASSPASATGGEFSVKTETVSASLSTVPSLTMSCST